MGEESPNRVSTPTRAIVALTDAKAMAPNDALINDGADVSLGLTQYLRGDFSGAGAACERAGTGEEEL